VNNWRHTEIGLHNFPACLYQEVITRKKINALSVQTRLLKGTWPFNDGPKFKSEKLYSTEDQKDFNLKFNENRANYINHQEMSHFSPDNFSKTVTFMQVCIKLCP
jgi:hypothetical protein